VEGRENPIEGRGVVSDDTVFGKILRREIPATFVYEDDDCAAFKDVSPRAPVHILVVPKKPIKNLADATEADAALLGRLMLVAAKVARDAGCGDAFRLVANTGEGAGQTVFHLHLHVMGGRAMTWPPG
jgi:histidine triad (HIT) family protein